ncbi:MAG: aldose epimerase family protein [Ahrensia sp.]
MVEYWGLSDDGQSVERVIISNGTLTASVITLGATLQDLRLEGHPHSLVLGFDSYFDYAQQEAYVGGIVGRVSNRIGGGAFTLDGKNYTLDRNEGSNTLHGGAAGFDKLPWRILSAGDDFVTMELRSPDGDMGFPGTLLADVRYRIVGEATLEVVLRAQTDKPTVCSMSQHSYFNLHDGGASAIDNHVLSVHAARVVAVDAYDVPDGSLTQVADTELDFTAARPIGATMLDINYCVGEERRALRPVARLAGNSGVTMEIATTEPGLQLYTADYLERTPARESGLQYKARSGICLEPQVWPDAVNKPHFPSARLDPGETLRQETTYAFSKMTN